MLKWRYLNISFKSFITLPWACPVNSSVTKSPVLYLHSFSHLLPWRVSKSKFDFASFWTFRKPYLFGAFEFEFEKFCVQQYWFTVCRFDFFWNDFITWFSENVLRLSLSNEGCCIQDSANTDTVEEILMLKYFICPGLGRSEGSHVMCDI